MRKCNYGKMAELCDTHHRGSSSFRMHEPGRIAEYFDLKKGDFVLDLGCGPGDYSIECAQIVGFTGKVFAMDKQKELLEDLELRAKELGINNIVTFTQDITNPLPIQDNSVDLCIIVTVLHIPGVSSSINKIFAEVRRVLKHGGCLITIDVNTKDLSFGPPLNMRLLPSHIENEAIKAKLTKECQVDFEYTYLMKFIAQKENI